MSPADRTTESELQQRPACCPASQPTDLELVEHHLRPWVEASALSTFVHDADMYAAGPDDLARMFTPVVSKDGERAWYFFTRLRPKSTRGMGRRFARTVATGGGLWHGEAKEKAVVDAVERREVGRRQFFSFMTVDAGTKERVRTGWIMAELRLVGDREHVEDHRVLCKVYRSPRYRGSGESSGVSVTKKPAFLENDDAANKLAILGKANELQKAADARLAALPLLQEAAAEDANKLLALQRQTLADEDGPDAPATQKSAAENDESEEAVASSTVTNKIALSEEVNAITKLASWEAPANKNAKKTSTNNDGETTSDGAGAGSAESSTASPTRQRSFGTAAFEASVDEELAAEWAAADKVNSSATRSRTKATDEDGEGISSAAKRKRLPLHDCPHCRCHLEDAAKASVGRPAEFESETGIPLTEGGVDTGDLSCRIPTVYNFF